MKICINHPKIIKTTSQNHQKIIHKSKKLSKKTKKTSKNHPQNTPKSPPKKDYNPPKFQGKVGINNIVIIIIIILFQNLIFYIYIFVQLYSWFSELKHPPKKEYRGSQFTLRSRSTFGGRAKHIPKDLWRPIGEESLNNSDVLIDY